MQLVAYGAQDIYLTGNPQITFFKVVYRRHTNFSMEAIEQTINGSHGCAFDATSTASGTVTISRNGDLVHKIYVTSETDAITDGSKLVSDVELEIGGQRIDRHYEEWMKIWNELSTPESKAIGLKSMQGCIGSSSTTGPKNLVQVPLQFWFCRNPGLALPLIALQYHEVKLKFNWGFGWGTAGTSACKVICDYIYLDTDERRRFAQVSHEYLIEQVQRQTGESGTTTKLNFNHPVKELIWTTDGTATTEAELRLKLNGHDRFSKQQPEYFQLRQPYDYHTAVPAQNLPTGAGTARLGNGNVVNFSDNGTVFDAEAGGNSAPTATKVRIFTSPEAISFGTLALDSAVTLAVTSGSGATDPSTLTPDKIFYQFLKSEVNSASAGTFSVGDMVLITLQGSSALAGGIVFTRIEDILPGEMTNSTNANFSHANTLTVRFSTNLATVSPSSEIDSAAEFSISSIVKVEEAGCRTSSLTKKINVYSFGLKPEEHQPSGTCNFSRIDVAQLIHDGSTASLATETVYAVNYNVLRIMSGMGGLAYSN